MTTKTTASRWHADEERRLEELEGSFNASDDITQMTHLEISQSLQSDSTAPQGLLSTMSTSVYLSTCYV